MSSIILNTVLSICFVAGKSGGHLLPCVTDAQHIKKEHPSAKMYIFTTGSELENKILDKHQETIENYTPSCLWDVPYGQPLLYLPFFCNATWYFCKSLYKLWNIRPQKIISYGGFNAIPVCLAAKLLNIPFEIYELNVEPGKATKFLSYFTDTIYTCFKETKQYFPNKTCIMSDYPVRFLQEDKFGNKKETVKKHSLDQHKKTILILGGSQGSTLLNEHIKLSIEQEPKIFKNIQIIHQTGHADSFDYQEFYKKQHIPAYVFDYHERLQDFYTIADLIICRAGAGTLFEIKFFDKPCISIPHQTANTNHQYKNVLALQQEYPEQFFIINQNEFSTEKLISILQKHFN